MISLSDRRQAVALINEAVAAGAPAEKASKALDISFRTYQRWHLEEGVLEDGRPKAQRPEPANKLRPEEREHILEICNQAALRQLSFLD